jgi:hypothetical protein
MFGSNWQDFFAVLSHNCHYHRLLHLHGQKFMLASNVLESIESISAFFPLPELCNFASSSFTILHIEDENLYQELEKVPESFLWRDEPFLGELFQASALVGAIIYKRLPSETGYMVLRPVGERAILIVTTKHTPKNVYVLLRVIREITYRSMENRGAISLHAAGFHWQNRGFLVIGPGGSGKTTFLFHALEEEGASYVGNDHIFLMQDPWWMGTFPLVVRCGQAMLAANPRLRFLTSEPPRSQKYELLPSFLSQVFGCVLEREARIHVILIPNFCPSLSSLSFKKMTREQIIELMLAETYTPEDPWFRRPWIEPRLLPKELLCQRVITMIQALVESVPIIRFSFGANISAQSSICEQILSLT